MCRFTPPCTRKRSPQLPLIAWDGRSIGHKAALRSGDTTIYIERAHWESLQPLAKQALLSRMLGYVNGAECEPCADEFGKPATTEDAKVLDLLEQRLKPREP